MFNGSDEELRQTRVTQPAVFLHSVIQTIVLGEEFKPDMVAGPILVKILKWVNFTQKCLHNQFLCLYLR